MSRILVTGPQGSGKTTQAKLLAEVLNVPFIGMGEVLRKRSQINDVLGQSIKADLDKGGLVNNKIVADFCREKVAESDCQNGFVMDGYPRSEQQAKLFDPNFDKVIYLDIKDEEVLERLLKRGRIDDTPELIKERLGIYHKETEPLLNSYREKGILEIINGSKTIDEIQGEIRVRVNET